MVTGLGKQETVLEGVSRGRQVFESLRRFREGGVQVVVCPSRYIW